MIIFIYFNKSLLLNEWPLNLIHEDMHQLVAHVTELVFQLSLIEVHPSLFLRFCLPISVSLPASRFCPWYLFLPIQTFPKNQASLCDQRTIIYDVHIWTIIVGIHTPYGGIHPPLSPLHMHNCSVIFNIRDWMLWFTVFVSHWYNILQACKIHMRIQDYSFVVFSCWYELPSDLLSTLPILRYLGALLKYNVLFKIFVILQIFTIDLNM